MYDLPDIKAINQCPHQKQCSTYASKWAVVDEKEDIFPRLPQHQYNW